MTKIINEDKTFKNTKSVEQSVRVFWLRSVSLDRGSLDVEGLKKLLIYEQKEYFGYDVIEESIKVEDKGTHGWLLFNYKDCDNEIEDGKCGFFKLNVV